MSEVVLIAPPANFHIKRWLGREVSHLEVLRVAYLGDRCGLPSHICAAFSVPGQDHRDYGQKNGQEHSVLGSNVLLEPGDNNSAHRSYRRSPACICLSHDTGGYRCHVHARLEEWAHDRLGSRPYGLDARTHSVLFPALSLRSESGARAGNIFHINLHSYNTACIQWQNGLNPRES